MQFVPKLYKIFPINFNLSQCLYVACTGIPGEVIHISSCICRAFLTLLQVIEYFNEYLLVIVIFGYCAAIVRSYSECLFNYYLQIACLYACFYVP